MDRLLKDRDHQRQLASRVNAEVRKAEADRRENRKRQEGVEIPSRRGSDVTPRPAELKPSPAHGSVPRLKRPKIFSPKRIQITTRRK